MICAVNAARGANFASKKTANLWQTRFEKNPVKSYIERSSDLAAIVGPD